MGSHSDGGACLGRDASTNTPTLLLQGKIRSERQPRPATRPKSHPLKAEA